MGAHDHGHGLARRLVAGVWSFPPSPEKNTKTEKVVMRSGSTQFHCRRSRTKQGPDLHEDSSPWATTRQRNTKDPYDLISSTRRFEPWSARYDRSTRVHGAAASRAEPGRTARGERIRALSSTCCNAWPP